MEKVKTQDLRFGMYIARSVRNKLGELLLPEGIYINRRQQIDRLIRHDVESVYIDFDKSLSNLDIPHHEEFEEADITPAKDPESLVLSVKEELVIAEKTYLESQYVLTNVFDKMKYGKEPDEEEFSEVVDEIIDSISRNSHALQSLAVLRAQDVSAFQHSVNVCINSLVVAKNLFKNHEILLSIGKGALLHDIGKSRLANHILKKGYNLSHQEYELFKRHPQLGITICNEQDIQDRIVREIILHHHEAYDGSGYPDRLFGKHINRYANIVSIADYYDELTASGNLYERVSPPTAIRMITKMSGKRFDPRIVNNFVSNIGIYPIGSFLKFESGRIGLVTTFAQDNIADPILKILTDEHQNPIDFPTTTTLKKISEKIIDYNVKYQLDYSIQTIL